MKTPSAGRSSEALGVTRYVLVSIALALASLALLPFYGVALVLMPLPSLLATMEHGRAAGVIVALAAALPVTLLSGLGLGMGVAAITLCLGVGQALLTRSGIQASRMLTICIGVFILVASATTGLAFASGAVTVPELLAASQAFQTEFARLAGQSSKETAQLAKEFREMYVYLLPSGIIVLCLATGLGNFLISQLMLRSRKYPSVRLSRFSEWQVPWYLTWGFLIGLACAVGYRYLAPAHRQIALYTGLNLIVVFGTLYMVQGLAIVVSISERFKLATPVRAALLLLAGFLQFLVQALTWLGLFDTWFNYRKLNREQ